MPVSGFLSSIADKAQSAIQGSPLAAHLPSHARPHSPDAAHQPSANEAATQGGYRSHALDSLQYQIRAFGQQYSNATPVQKIITTEKGVAIDFDSVSRDAKAQSKELYTWGQSEADDLKDVTDRLAFLNFVQGSLASSLAAKLDAARSPLKALRDAEAALAPRRNIRTNLQNQVSRLEHDQQRGNDKKIADLRDQIRKAELEDQAQEREVEIVKRKAVRESEQLKWEAIREYGEKLVLLSQAAPPIVAALPSIPPTPNQPYTGAQSTAAVRASLQRALDNYKTGHINLPPQLAGADLSRSDTRSFGESHASELSSISSDITGNTHIGNSPTFPLGGKVSAQASPNQSSPTASSPTKIQSPPINAQALNHSPAPIPPLASSASPPPLVAPDPTRPSATVPAITPTVAETGVPVSAGADGPGPASGSLHDIKGASSSAGPRSGGLPADEARTTPFGQTPPIGVHAPAYESAEDEKRRLQSLYSQTSDPNWEPLGGVAVNNTPASQHESAEEEKKRLERQERERILREGGSHQHDNNHESQGAPPKKDDELPPYQDI